MTFYDNNSLNAVVIVAAGRGSRIGNDGEGPKQYRRIGGETVLAKTVHAFAIHPEIDLIQVVIHADDREMYDEAVPEHSKLLPPVSGGATRQESCMAGLAAFETRSISKVLIHDAARPFVSGEIISNVLSGIEPGSCALPAVAVADTLKRTHSDDQGHVVVSGTVSRDHLYSAQTPQGFVFSEILSAHQKAYDAGRNDLTDDAAVGEFAGMETHIVPGSAANRKITTLEDLEQARKQAQMQLPDVRTGNGYDVHRLIPDETGNGVILCGIAIPHSHRLDGHSDADVGLHALTDALLGTIGEGDIGSHFPPTDPQWKGASSDRFLAHACELVRNHGGVITHCDIMIICEMPKIGPHREVMRSRISEICGIDVSRISVKATTNEKIGFIGRGEGIAAIANATVVIDS